MVAGGSWARSIVSLAVFGALLAAPVGARAALAAVAGTPDPAVDSVVLGGPKQSVAYSLSNGFPLWYEDASGLRLALCTDASAELAPGVPFSPCLAAQPFPTFPPSFPSNFGSEAFWWTAGAFTSFTSTAGGGDFLFVASLEAGFANLLVADGNQAAFGRIRIRAHLPVPGTYLVTHPYGERAYVVPAVTAGREIVQTQDVGNLVAPAPAGPPPAGDFTLALADGPTPPPPLPATQPDPAIDVGMVSDVVTGIGPFLVAADPVDGPIVAADGATYLSNPGTDLEPLPVRVAGGLPDAGGEPRNFARIRLLDPPTDPVTGAPTFFLNATDQSQEIRLEAFQLAGKLFDASPNAPPVAVPDAAGTARGAPLLVDVLANDADLPGPGNAHGLDPGAIGLPSTSPADPPGTILLTRPLATAGGGTVRRTTSLATGKTTLLYTPAAGFTGVDTFQYVVQDRGGLVSAPATVTVTVEELAITAASFRPRTGRFAVAGTSSDRTANEVTVLGAPRARLAGAEVVPPVATAAGAHVALRLGAGAIDFRLALDAPPASAITAVHLHAGAAGEGGPAIFSLHDLGADGPLAGTRSGTLGPDQLFAEPDARIETFADAVAAIREGRAYVDVHTADHPAGELRGALVLPVIGTAPVDPATGAFRLTTKLRVAPAGPPEGVAAVSANGVHAGAAEMHAR